MNASIIFGKTQRAFRWREGFHVIRRATFFLIVAYLAGTGALSRPQDESYVRLARLSYLEGHVSFQHGSDVDWSAASINMPMEPGDRIYTGNDGRAEIEFDDGSVFRLAENTDVEILSLRQELIQLRILLGLSTLNVFSNADFEINTPAAAFNPVREGIYRFDVIENGDTDAIVRKGELQAANNEFSQRLRPGDLLHLSPRDKGHPEISLYDHRDAWDEWNDRRTADLQVYGNQRYLPDGVSIGASELDRYGHWVNVESYGTAWVPYGVDPYWAPYSVGRWCYRPFYGWTWVSYEPWGWLPYHYGRWYRSGIYGWCWLPGPAFSFNFWSPGLVTFYHGPGWVSWCPLGPGDYYDVRHYRYNHGIYSHQLAQLRNLNTRAQGDPFNRDVHGAFRTVQTEQFRNGSFDNQTRNTRWGNVDRPWSQGTLVRDRLGIQPSPRSYSAVTDTVAVRPSRASTPLPAVVRNIPAGRSADQAQFNRITNPQIRSVSSGNMRRAEPGSDTPDTKDRSRPNTRVIQIPQNPSAAPAASEGRRADSPRLSGNRPGRADSQKNNRGGFTQQSTQPEKPSNQNPPRRIERTVPEQRTTPAPGSPQSSPRSELRLQDNYSNARPAVGRWSDSNPPATTRSVESPAAPGNNGRGRWTDSNPGTTRFRDSGKVQVFTMPRFEGGGRGGNSSSGLTRPADSGRSLSYTGQAPSGASVGRASVSRSSEASQSFGGRSSRNAPAGGSAHRR